MWLKKHSEITWDTIVSRYSNFKAEKFQPINERTSQASLITSSPIGDGTEETVPGGNRS